MQAQIQLGNILLNTDTHRVYVDNKEVELKNREYELLLFLMLNVDMVFSKETLYEKVWGQEVILAVVGLMGVVFAVIYWLLVAAWLYKEAKRANMQYGIWFLAGLIGNLAAVVIFITVRSCIRVQCFHCKSWQKKTDYCSECGASMQMICPSCGEKANREDHFCGACGKKIQN